ncbi:hypothetical protein EDEG_03897 [Edhazardia aedis USNM 41457]|uniref:Uncharacterized protein n=1 Tax=Edhazardia aedis (strain USNM 41457) TaxID=1003232 RepID=J8ZP88_EDHAE|nr:hypothetical protein EDEG_03897 [Edhazardia aedis USNM 41457]|eukprot:EJW01528.1 hypothetical protein EDEG_03897 [Edhazardia aedis USNM 41457]
MLQLYFTRSVKKIYISVSKSIIKAIKNERNNLTILISSFSSIYAYCYCVNVFFILFMLEVRQKSVNISK